MSSQANVLHDLWDLKSYKEKELNHVSSDMRDVFWLSGCGCEQDKRLVVGTNAMHCVHMRC